MKKHLTLKLVAAFMLGLAAAPAPATFAEGEVTIETTTVSTEITEPSLFQAAENLNTNETFNTSAFFAGLNLSDSSTVKGVGWFAGNALKLGGTYDYGAAASNTLDISGTIENDLFAVANTININDSATLKRNVFATGGVLNVDADVAGSIYFAGDTMFIANDVVITGDLNLNVNSLTIGQNVKILGTLNYNDNAAVSGLSNANIANTNTYTIITQTETKENQVAATISSFCFMLFSYLLFVLIFNLICPNFLRTLRKKAITAEYTLTKGLTDFGLGFLFLIATPIALLIALITIIGIPITFIGGVFYAFALYLSSMATGFFIGDKILIAARKKSTKKLNAEKANKRTSLFLSTALGLVIVAAIELIPFISGLITFASLCFGIGLTIHTLFRK